VQKSQGTKERGRPTTQKTGIGRVKNLVSVEGGDAPWGGTKKSSKFMKTIDRRACSPGGTSIQWGTKFKGGRENNAKGNGVSLSRVIGTDQGVKGGHCHKLDKIGTGGKETKFNTERLAGDKT